VVEVEKPAPDSRGGLSSFPGRVKAYGIDLGSVPPNNEGYTHHHLHQEGKCEKSTTKDSKGHRKEMGFQIEGDQREIHSLYL
jgi:hypothetical protein